MGPVTVLGPGDIAEWGKKQTKSLALTECIL